MTQHHLRKRKEACFDIARMRFIFATRPIYEARNRIHIIISLTWYISRIMSGTPIRFPVSNRTSLFSVLEWFCNDRIAPINVFSEANAYAGGFAVRWKSTFQYLRMRFCHENVGNWSPLRQNESELSLRSIQGCFPLLHRPSRRKLASALFRSNWIKYDYNVKKNKRTLTSVRPSWIEKVMTAIFCNGASGEAENSSG